jgi:alginate O-acetyltransferase complex protein AlgI
MMVFCSPLFLFLFLPLVLAINFVLPPRGRNVWLLLMSLLFYAWGERAFTAVMLISILFNYSLVLAAEPLRRRGRQTLVITVAVVVNLALLVVFKYANFLCDNLNVLLVHLHLDPIQLKPIHLPIGISFFTFHALSYVVDVYRGRTPAQKNPIDFGLYITLFPQLVAGPIVRYSDIARQLSRRRITESLFAQGVRRFVSGLAKKMLIANTVGAVADRVFGLPSDQLSMAVAWLGAVCYMAQIYFDFSGYSDMAIGLAAMLGFTFKENFEHPYISQSITEFWRRWHISLSTWFRDYLYIPLGGNRVGPVRLGLNLLTVFLLCGLWHGASWTFLIWGLYHGLFLILERGPLGGLLDRLWVPLRHAYALLVVLVGWVFFRATTIESAGCILNAMIGRVHPGLFTPYVGELLLPDVALALAAAVLFSCPVARWFAILQRRLLFLVRHTHLRWNVIRGTFLTADLVTFALLLVASYAEVAATTYNPFIYFRF